MAGPITEPQSTSQTPDITAAAPQIEQSSATNNQPIQEPKPPSAIQGSIAAKQVTGAPPFNPAAVAHVSRLANLGHLAASLLGKQYSYQVDPQTGKTVQTEIKQKPGDVFRHIVAGAILGGAASAQHPSAPGTGMLGGFVTGGTASMEADKNADTERRKRAQDQFANQQKVRAEDREDTLAQASIAHMHIQDLHADAQMDLIQQEHIDKLNQYNNSILDVVKEKGTPSRIIVNGVDLNATPNNGAAFSRAYSANPRAFDPPQGYYRIHSQTVDNSGLTYKIDSPDKKGPGWFDADGNRVDMSTRTTHHFYDIPKSAMAEHVQKTGKEWNQIAGYKAFPDDDKMHDGTLQDVMSLKTIGVKNTLEENKAKLEIEQVKLESQRVRLESQRIKTEIEKGNRTDMLAAYEANKLAIQSATARLKDADFTDPAEKKQALDDLAEATANIKAIQEQLYPKTKLPEKPGAPAPKASKFDIPTLQKQIPDENWPNVVKSGMTVVANPNTGTVKALFPDDAKAALARGGIEVPVPDKFKPSETPNFEATIP